VSHFLVNATRLLGWQLPFTHCVALLQTSFVLSNSSSSLNYSNAKDVFNTKLSALFPFSTQLLVVRVFIKTTVAVIVVLAKRVLSFP
jgi:hypothetical protein